MSDKEIEIKVQIQNCENLISFLKKNARLLGKQHQVDTYFSPAHRNFVGIKPVKEWLRLRDSDGKFSINYKNWHYEKDGKSHFCDEYETPLDNKKQLEKIFKALDIKEIVKVDKIRTIYLYKNYEIAIDSVKQLGCFVEIEYKGKRGKSTPAQITSEMISFLETTNCGQTTRNFLGYPYLLL